MSRATAVLVAAATVAIALAGIGFAGTHSARKYVPAFSAVYTDKGPVFREGCLIYTDSVTSPPCRYGEVGSAKKVVVFGDSHALQWTPALIEIASERGWELTMLMRKNCPAAAVDTEPVCNRWRRNALARIANENPSLVFVASNTASNNFVRKNGKRLSRAASEPYFRRGMYSTLLGLRKGGAEVTLMRDLPMSHDFLPSECVERFRNHPGRCTFEASRPLSEAYDFAAAKRLPRVQIIDPMPEVCPGSSCRAVSGNILKYRDRGHISATYARSLTRWLGQRLQDPFVGEAATSGRT